MEIAWDFERSALANNVRMRRKARGLNQEILAEMVRVHPNTIKDIEAGKSEGTSATRQAIAENLGCTEADLFAAPPSPEKAIPLPDLKTFADMATQLSQLSPNYQRIVLALISGDAGYIRQLPRLEHVVPLVRELLKVRL